MTLKCDKKGCKSNDAQMGYIETENDTFIMQLCFEHWKEIRND